MAISLTLKGQRHDWFVADDQAVASGVDQHLLEQLDNMVAQAPNTCPPWSRQTARGG